MAKLRYELTIQDNGAEDRNIVITLTDMSGKRGTRCVTEALVPALNQLKQTLSEDAESIL